MKKNIFPLLKFIAKNVFSICLFYNTYDRDSFEKIKEYYKEIIKKSNDIIYTLVRSKYELTLKEDNKDYIFDEEVLEFADKNKILLPIYHLMKSMNQE